MPFVLSQFTVRSDAGILFERKTQEWKQTQRRLADQIAEHHAANRDHFEDGLLELSKKAYFLCNKENLS